MYVETWQVNNPQISYENHLPPVSTNMLTFLSTILMQHHTRSLQLHIAEQEFSEFRATRGTSCGYFFHNERMYITVMLWIGGRYYHVCGNLAGINLHIL